MHATTLTRQQAVSMTPRFAAGRTQETIETRLWLEEHAWLVALLKSEHNVSPTFRCPDLISACVSLVFAEPNAVERIFEFLGTELILRVPHHPRRREAMWMPQYELLLPVQRSPANQHPNPKFQLDQLTTACVALSRKAEPSGTHDHAAIRRGRAHGRSADFAVCDLPQRRGHPVSPVRLAARAQSAAPLCQPACGRRGPNRKSQALGSSGTQ